MQMFICMLFTEKYIRNAVSMPELTGVEESHKIVSDVVVVAF